MYELQQYPDREVVLSGGSVVHPLATLKDECGDIAHIIEDDHCFVLVTGNHSEGFSTTKHWFTEAAEALSSIVISHQNDADNVSLSYNELGRAASLLDGFAKECNKEAERRDLPPEDRRTWLSEAISYETASKRLRDVWLQTDAGEVIDKPS